MENYESLIRQYKAKVDSTPDGLKALRLRRTGASLDGCTSDQVAIADMNALIETEGAKLVEEGNEPEKVYGIIIKILNN